MTLDEVISYNRLFADMETKSGDLEVDERKLKVIFEEIEYDDIKKYLSEDVKKEYYRMTIPDEIKED